MAFTATVTPGAVVQDSDKITVSLLNQIANPTIDVAGSVGSIQLGNGAVTNTNVASAAGINLSKLELGASGKMIVGNATGVGAWATLAGDVTLSFDQNSGNALATIGSAKIATAMIQDDAVTGLKIASETIDNTHIAEDAVTGSELQDHATIDAQRAVTTNHIKDGAVTAAKLASGALPSADQTIYTSGGTWTKPSGVSLVYVIVVGAGGGGHGAGAGGAGGACESWIDVSSVSTVTVTVGTGGSGGENSGHSTNYVAPGAGGNSAFGGFMTSNGGAAALTYGGNGASGATSSTIGSARNFLPTDFVSGTYGHAGASGSSGVPGGAGGAGLVIVNVIG